MACGPPRGAPPLPLFPRSVDPPPPDAPRPSGPPELPPSFPSQGFRWWAPGPCWLSLDRLGILQAIGGFVLSLVALFSSYDHITAFSRTIQLQQQWGIVFILASVATVALDAELASRSRLRAADEAAEERDRANQERNRAAVDEVGRRPWRENAKQRALSALIRQHCFPDQSSSTPLPPTEPDSSSF